MSTRRTFNFALLSSGLLAACSHYAPPLRVAYQTWPGYAPLQLVRTLNALSPGQWQAFDSGSITESIAALRNGRVHAAAITLQALLKSRAEGTPLRVAAVLDISAGADVVLARPGLAHRSRWRGARIGHEADALGHQMLTGLLQQAGLSPDSVRTVPLSFDQHEAAWRAGQVDLLVTFEPVASRLVQSGAVRVYDSRQLPPELMIADVLAVHADALPQQGDHLTALLTAIFRAQQHYHHLTLDAQYRLAPWLGLPPNKVLTAFKGVRLTNWEENRAQMIGQPAPLLQTARHISQFLFQHGITERPAPLDDLLEPRYLPLEEPQ